MTYSASKKILAPDINGFSTNNHYNLNQVWSTGSGDYGYGLTSKLVDDITATVYQSFPVVNAADKISYTHWTQLIKYINAAATHQGIKDLLTSMVFRDESINPGDSKRIRVISNQIESALTDNLKLISDNRLNAAAQGNDITSTITTTTTWNDKLTATFEIKFPSHDKARYFFNAGGQFKFSSSHSKTVANTVNNLLNDICSNAGTLVFSSGTAKIGGISFNPITKVGGGGLASSSSIANNDYGFNYFSGSSYTYAANSSVTLFTQSGDVGYRNLQAGSRMIISANYNKSGTFKFTIVLDEVPNGYIANAGTNINLVVKQPTSLYLVNTSNWSAPTITTSISTT